ncbi:hypothetical protein D3C84_480650 [compost metagenome]
MLNDGFTDHPAAAHHQVEHPGREAGAGDDFGNRPGAARHQIGRFQHHAVAVGQGRGDLPGRNGDGEIPRGDQADHPQRLAGHFHRDAGAHRGQHFAGLAQAFAGVELEDIAGAAHFADGLGQGLAFFPGQQRTELFAAGEDFAADLVQRVAARLDTGSRPGRKRGAGGGNGLIDLSGVGLGILADHIGQVGRIDIARIAGSGEPLAADIVVVTRWIGHE